MSRLAAHARIAQPKGENRNTAPKAISESSVAKMMSAYCPSIRLPWKSNSSPGIHGGSVCGNVPSSNSVAFPTTAPKTIVDNSTT